MYLPLREKAFATTAQDLHLDLPSGSISVYGVIIEWNMGNQVATIVTFITGDASLYMKSGMMMIGGIAHEPIRKYVAEMHTQAQEAVAQAKPQTEINFPPVGSATFWLLTNKGKFAHTENVRQLAQVKDAWHRLFDRANLVISFFRQQSEKSSQEESAKIVFTKDMIEQIRIDVSCDGQSAISMLLHKDGTLNRQGDGNIPANRKTATAKTDGKLFRDLVNALDEKIFEHAGSYDFKEKKGMPVIYRVVFLGAKPNLRAFEFRLGSESEVENSGLYAYLDRFVMKAVKGSEEWWQQVGK
ncbi:MAG TPA: hypothetical protein VL651_11820 [Bacteroidia bacterium]|jgi:hypothetical protein|nr:hypothetical protein [Bacteroidia bacterium]